METIVICVLALSAALSPVDLPPECNDHPQEYVVYEGLLKAGVPQELWNDFAALAGCESNYRVDAVGDDGMARGLYQTHWWFWLPWAHSQGLMLDAVFDDWSDPTASTRLAFYIGEYYDLPLGRNRFNQYSAKPWWPGCQDRVPPLDAVQFVLVGPNSTSN